MVANFVPKLNAWRVTFTYPLINCARRICFLVDGNKRQEVIAGVLDGDVRYPASRVDTKTGESTWIIGEA